MTMNTTSFTYPKFHDSYHSGNEARPQKEIDIDASIYHLLSLYLGKDALNNNTSLMSSRMRNKQKTRHLFGQKSSHYFQQRKSWLGEESPDEHDMVLERNTISNTSIQVTQLPRDNAPKKKKKKRAKAVSFSDTVTVVLSHEGVVSMTKLNKEEDEEECFVDALEYIS
ncbi:hypothetical protein BD560DRAFT_444396 [Blakeslea trispora]|nr:hypothetical protein BD560DRAFT_444396 [Blakeslea trispora]